MGLPYKQTRIIQIAFESVRAGMYNLITDVERELLNKLDVENSKSVEARVEAELRQSMEEALTNKNGGLDAAVKKVEELLDKAMATHELPKAKSDADV
jgi:predicted transcriptional regulator